MLKISNIYDINAELNLMRAVWTRKKDNARLSGRLFEMPRYTDNLFIHPVVARSAEFQAALEEQHRLVEEGKEFDSRLNMRRIIDSLEKAVAGETVALVQLEDFA